MVDTGTDVSIRPLEEGDLPEADRIMRVAFGTFMGLPDPSGFMGDADYVGTRWLADPSAAFGAYVGDELVGSSPFEEGRQRDSRKCWPKEADSEERKGKRR